jgi:hypothetical protein
LSLEHLRTLPSDTIKAQLLRYKGVGPKSVACEWGGGCGCGGGVEECLWEGDVKCMCVGSQ